MADNKAQYSKPASQVDLEARLENGNESSAVLSTSDTYTQAESEEGQDYTVEGNVTDDYLGTDPIYQNYANKTEKPGVSSKSVEDQVAADFVERMKSAAPQVNGGDEQEKEGNEVSDPEVKITGS